jgi:WD40 repeat protein
MARLTKWPLLAALMCLNAHSASPQVAGPAPGAVGKAAVVGPAPAVAKEPLLRLEAGGPTTDVTTLAFSPDGKTLYAAGYDKVVRVWKLDPATKEFVPQRDAFRVPIGPGLFGAINAMAISDDGNWLAVGGIGAFQGQAGFRHPGLVVPTQVLTLSMREDIGTIYVFETSKPDQVRALRGHRGAVAALSFVQLHAGATPLLVSAAGDWDPATGQIEGGLRLWDVSANATVAKFTGLPDPGAKLPGLAAWKSGPNANQVHVALAWDDGDLKKPGRLRLWDVEKQQMLRGEGEGGFNNSVVFLPGDAAVLSGCFLNNNGHVHRWTASAHESPRLAATQAAFPFEHNEAVTRFFFPRALAAVSARANGQLDHAAVVLRAVDTRAKTTQHILQVVSLRDAGRSPKVSLWSDGRVPVLATAPRGGHIAVAGAQDHSIQVFDINSLLAGRASAQTLRSIGMRPGDAAFVKQMRDGKPQLGIVFADGVAETRGIRPRNLFARDMIFDFNARSLFSANSGWAHDTPALNGWSATAAASAVVVRSPVGSEKRITLPDGWTVSDYGLLPPSTSIPAPLLAVAYHVGNSPRFSLYNAGAGQQLVEFTGHLNKIRSVAFSGDGRFLVSASDDQTLSIWSLNKLDQFFNQQAQIHGLVVQTNEANKLVVAGLTAEMREAGLKKDDIIEGLMLEGRLEPLASPLEFQNMVLKLKPGENATLRLQGGRSVNLRTGQAIQQRTPLIMLFVTNGGRAEDREWLAWNPIGPYDSSDPKVVRSFGWHFNPVKPGDSVQFTSAEKDLPKERREGLLRHLVARGSLAPALEDWDNEKKEKPLSPPKMTMGIDGMKDRIVRQNKNTVWLHAAGIAADRIDSVRWSIDGGPESLSTDTGIDHSHAVTLSRGLHKIKAVLRTREDVPQQFEESLTVRYIPLAPTVTPKGDAAGLGDKLLEVMKPTFKLSAIVTPGAAGEKTVVQVFHQQAPLDKTPTPTNAIEREIALKPGHNLIEVHAQHEATDKDTEAAELVRLVLNVKYTPPAPPKDAPLPVILLESIVPLIGGVEPAERQPVLRKGTPIVVNAPKILIAGKITTPNRLALAEWSDGVKSGPLHFDRQAPGIYFLNQPITLSKTGLQTITFRARSATTEPEQKADTEERIVQVDYRPALPIAAGIHAVAANPVFIDDGKGSPEVLIRGTLLQPRDPSNVKVTAICLVNDKEYPATIDAIGRNWTAKVRLEPGSNKIQILLDNGWQDSISGNLRLELRRPPLNLRAEVPASTSDPMIRMEALVESALPIKEAYVRATVRGKEIRDFFLVKPKTPEDKTWKIHLTAPLKVGNNEIRILVGNDDGSALPLVRTVKFEPKKPLPPAPAVAFVQPAISDAASDLAMSVTRSNFPLQFKIGSVSALKRVALFIRREGQKTDVKELDLAETVKTDKGYTVKVGADLNLAPGVTWISLEAEDQDTRSETPALVVNYLPPPVRLQLETLESRNGKFGSQPILENANGKWTAAAVPNARLWLVGKVIWSEKDSLLTDKQLVSVFVNGSQQWRGELEPPAAGSLARRFKAEILLNREKGNDIEVELPSLKLADNRRSNFTVDCLRPMDEQWLHVQIISPEEVNEGKLLDQVLKSLQGTNYSKESGEFTRAGFERARLYPPLITGVDYDKLAERLLRIRREVAQRSRDGWPNDVVLIYFSGGETVDPSGRLEALTQPASSQTLITREQIAEQFADMLGVKVLLLDVTRPRNAAAKSLDAKTEREVARWLETPTRHAWIRAAWLDTESPPQETRLLTALQEALLKAELLGDVPLQVAQRFRQLAERFPTLQADWYLPQALHGLSLRERK